MARKSRPYWLCRKCKNRNERAKRKCLFCGAAKPRKRVPRHAITLQRDSYEFYCQVAEKLHGVADERCCVCGKPRGERRHDRDHDHKTGHPRGLACVVCNKVMVHQLTAERAREIAAYLDRAEKFPEHFTEHFTKPEDGIETRDNTG